MTIYKEFLEGKYLQMVYTPSKSERLGHI